MHDSDDHDSSSEDNLGEDLANLGKAIAPFVPKYRNIRKVCSRLLGDVPEAAFDALVARLRLSQTRSQAEAIRTIIECSGLPPSVAYEMVRKQEAIDTLAADALGRIAQDDVSNTGSTEDTPDEWFDVFRREAVDRSSDDIRETFVRILAGEIRQPGTFSVGTLRILGTIDTSTAEKFLRAASVCMSLEQSDARVPAVGGELGQNCLQDIGLPFSVLTLLTENGLLHPDYSCYMPYGPINDRIPAGVQLPPNVQIPPNTQIPFRHQGKLWRLLGTSDATRVKSIRVVGAAFTTAGRELLEIVDIDPMPEFTTRLKDHFAKSNYEMVEVKDGGDT